MLKKIKNKRLIGWLGLFKSCGFWEDEAGFFIFIKAFLSSNKYVTIF